MLVRTLSEPSSRTSRSSLGSTSHPPERRFPPRSRKETTGRIGSAPTFTNTNSDVIDSPLAKWAKCRFGSSRTFSGKWGDLTRVRSVSMELGISGNSPTSTKTAEAGPGLRDTVNVALYTLPRGILTWLEPPSMTPWTTLIGNTISKRAPMSARARNRPSPANSSEIIVVSWRQLSDRKSLCSEGSSEKTPSGSTVRRLVDNQSDCREGSPEKIPSGSAVRWLSDNQSDSNEGSPEKTPAGSVASLLRLRLSTFSEDSPEKTPTGSVVRLLSSKTRMTGAARSPRPSCN